MNKKIIFFAIIAILGFNQAYAVPPPDFIIQVVSNLGSYFAIAAAFLSSMFFGFFNYLKMYFSNLSKIQVIIIGLIFIGGISFSGAYFYDNYQQKIEIEKIKKEMSLSKINIEKDIIEKENILENIEKNNNNFIYTNSGKIEENIKKDKIIEANLSKVQNINIIEKNKNLDKKEKIKRKYSLQEKKNFLKKYYKNIDEKKLEEAYIMGSQKVNFEKFSSWYKNIDYLKINSINKIVGADGGFKVDLNISENGEITNFIVFKYVGVGEDGNLKIIKTEINKKLKIGEKNLGNLTISNKEFSKIYKNFFPSYNKHLILDAREDLEVQIGKMPGSTHIRFAELKAGEYKKLQKYEIVYVYCWSGIRGKEVALFLRTKGINAVSLEDGAKGWYEFGGAWDGTIKFSSVFNKTEYKKLFMKDSLKKAINDGAVLVDVRKNSKFRVNHLSNSINVPLVDLPKNKWQDYIAKIPKKSKIITVCDDYVNCFYAKIVGIELEKRGFEFEGRYSLAYN